MNIKDIKKVELHVHLDGSIKAKTLSEINNISIEEANSLLIAKDKCTDLNEYLEKFDTPVSILQTKENLIRVSKELVSDLIDDNCIYAEVRFAPNKHISILSLDEVVLSVLEGLKSDKIKVNLLLCMMRGDLFIDNKNIIDLAYKYLNKGVVGIDLAGAEKIYKTSDYEELFNYAKKLNIPFTIHAGEADGVSSIKSAISFGAKRIGHGVRCIEDENIIDLIKEKDILLEVCPTSNIQTNTFENYIDHPIKSLYDKGIKISINTDNRTVSNINLNKEYERLKDNFDFNIDDFIKINKESIRHAFINEEEKERLLKYYD